MICTVIQGVERRYHPTDPSRHHINLWQYDPLTGSYNYARQSSEYR